MLIDTHCHLDFHLFDADRAKMIERARKEGVEMMINAGDDLDSSLRGLALATEYDAIKCTFGVHPNEAAKWDVKVEAAFVAAIAEDRLSEAHNIVAIGEIGLDYHWMKAPKEVQQTVLRQQLHVARREDLPVVIHCREAFDDVLMILGEEHYAPVVFHCFDGDLKIAQRIWEKGWITSFTAMMSYPKNEYLREVVKECPSHLFFLETDAPFLPHQNFRGQRNEPAYLKHLVKSVASLRGESFKKVCDQSSQNALTFFRLSGSAIKSAEPPPMRRPLSH